MNRPPFAIGEYYHIYNRGVEKRVIFENQKDWDRFLTCMTVFNTKHPVGSLHEFTLARNKSGKSKTNKQECPLVHFICFCINPNHFHFILKEIVDGGISEFMNRLSGGYTMYFNERYNRSGVLFQGRFKSKHINTNAYLLHLSAYVNLNFRVHKNFGGSTSKSRWEEYCGDKTKMLPELSPHCHKDIILGQFKNKKEYERFALSSLEEIKNRRTRDQSFDTLLID